MESLAVFDQRARNGEFAQKPAGAALSSHLRAKEGGMEKEVSE
jgi:hypothetical protein